MGGDKKQELLGIKLKNGILIGKRGTKSTPSPTWRLGFDFDQPDEPSSLAPNFPMNNSVSARKIGANLWEYQPQFNMISKDGGSRVDHRDHHHHHHHHHSHEKEGFDLPNQPDEHEPTDNPSQQPELESTLRRNVRELPNLHHLSMERNGPSLQHVSSASYCSSMEITPYNHAVTPTGSSDFRGRIGEASYSLKTSKQLVKVLNRIWNLEEQHMSNRALVKTLKWELENSQAQIKTLLQERKRDHQEINELKRSEQEHIKKSVQSVREELEVERKLRKHSENLHHKLSRELLDARSSFSNVVKELEREKRARILLESLCDEFAKGIRDYEQAMRLLKNKPEKKEKIERNNHQHDRLILHVSEAWLDERMQMKQAEARHDFSGKKSIFDNLGSEIETFLQAKQKQSLDSRVIDDISGKEPEENRLQELSLESMHLNEAGSAPRNDHDKETSTGKLGSNSVKKNHSCKTEMSEIAKEGLQGRKDKQAGAREKNLNQEKDDLIASILEGKNVTVRELMSRMTGPDPAVAETSSRWTHEGVKENTLMAKLLEARLESQFSRSRTVRG